MIMGLISNETLFYGGMFIAGFALVATIVFVFVTTISMMRLKAKFTAEYGDKIKVKGR